MNAREWLRGHPFLEPVARLHDQVEKVLEGIATTAPATPQWDDYLPDYGEGIALLQSAGAAVELEPVGRVVLALVGRLAEGSRKDPLAPGASVLRAELAQSPAQRIADWLLGEAVLAPSSPGLLRWLGWTAMRRHLQPVLTAFAGVRNEDRWQRSHCPGCGSPPAMAQLVGVDPGHVRFLACGCCGTRWRWRRTACPFCENDSHRLAVVTIESEAQLRLDHCEACRAYLKTYVGHGDEALMLADWSSLHLDVLARERGLEQKAASLYDLGALLEVAAD